MQAVWTFSIPHCLVSDLLSLSFSLRNYVAELLAGGPAWRNHGNSTKTKPIIAVVRGRQEFGPRALGHRSLLAVPDSVEMRDAW